MSSIATFLSLVPHKMVFVNILATSVVILGLLGYKIIFPTKNLNYKYLLLTLALLPLISILRPGSYESGDLTINIAKLMSFYQNLSEGNIIPRWSGELNATYGYPNFIFAYPLPYYISSIFHLLGFSFLNSLKLLLVTSFVGSGFAMFYWLKGKVSEENAFLGAILYLFSPYHLIDLHFRVDIGETLAFLFMPLTLLFIDKSIENSKFIWKFMIGVSTSFLILSHQAVSLLFFPIIIIYVLHFEDLNIKHKLRILPSITLGVLLSAYYWIPVIFEAKYTQQVNMLKSTVNFPQFWQLIFSPYRFGFLFQGPEGQLSPLIGYANLLVIFMLIFLIVKKNSVSLINYLGIVACISIYLVTQGSSIAWQHISLLRKIEFPFRILSIIIFSLSAIGAVASERLNKQYVFYVLTALAIGTSILNWGNRRNMPEIGDLQIAQNLPLTTSQGEGLFPAAPIYVDPKNVWRSKIPASHLETISGGFSIQEEKRSIEQHDYIINVKNDSVLVENTYYFPGWKLIVDGEEMKIDFTNPSFPGVITFPIQSGTHRVGLIFENTPVRIYSLVLSLVSLLLSGSYLIYSSVTIRNPRLTSVLLPSSPTTTTKTASSST